MPMDRSKYPPDWDDISRKVREEAGNRCEWCGVENHALGARDLDGQWWSFDEIERISDAEIAAAFGCGYPKIIRIVLTVAHIHDPDPMNVERSNLAALCNRCHLNHDRPHHIANAAATRERKRQEAIAATGQGSLL